VREALAARVGESEQVPPMYSSVKRAGVPLYRLARRGEVVEREPRKVRIERLEALSFAPPDLEIDVVCSPGTFVRALAADLGRDLGCGAHVVTLRRTRSHPFELPQAASVDALEAEARAGALAARLVPPADALGVPTLRLAPDAVRRVRHGGDLPPPPAAELAPGARVLALAGDATPVALLELGIDRRLRPLRVLVAAPA
jgi:tRNA pseudouridine55 synthase